MERAHGELGAWLTDALRGNDAHGLAHFHKVAVGKVGAVAFGAHAVPGLAAQHAAYLHLADAGVHYPLGVGGRHHAVCTHQHFARLGVYDIVHGKTAFQALCQFFDHLVALTDVGHHNALGGAAVVLADNNILRNVHKAARQVARVRRAQGRVGQAFAGALAGNEVFQNVQALAVVGADGDFDGLAGGIGDKAAHARQLADLRHAAAGAGIGHHKDGVARVQVRLQGTGHVLCCLGPNFDDAGIAFFVGDKALVVLLCHLGYLLFGALQQPGLLRRDHRVAHGHGDGGLGGIFVALGLNAVQHFSRHGGAVGVDAAVNNLAQLLLVHKEAHFILKQAVFRAAVYKAKVLRNRRVEDDAARSGVHQLRARLAAHLQRAAHLMGACRVITPS